MKRHWGLVACLIIALPVAAQNWPSFRGPGASGVADTSPTPTEWNGETGKNILWKTPIPGFGHSSPVIWGNRIFVTTAVPQNDKAVFLARGTRGDAQPKNDTTHDWRVYALDKNTGKVLWYRTARNGTPRSRRHGKSSQASPTPVTDGKVVIAYFGSEGLYAYDVEGKLLWKNDLGILDVAWFFDPDFAYGVASSPTIYRDVVILQIDLLQKSFLVAFRLTDGEQVWRVERGAQPSWGSPIVFSFANRDELVVNDPDFIRGYDPKTGEELWRLRGNSEETITTPVATRDRIYVASHGERLSPIYAIRPGASGDISLREGETSNKFIFWSRKRGGPHVTTPLIYDNALYLCSDLGILSAYDARTGKRLYKARLDRSGARHFASPVAADGKVYFANEDGEVLVAKAGPRYELLSTNPMGEPVMATPAISDGVLYVRGLKHLFAIGQVSPATATGSP